MKSELSPSPPAKVRGLVVDDDDGIREFMAAQIYNGKFSKHQAPSSAA